MGMAHTPLLLPTLIVLAVAAVEWRGSRAVAWAALAAGCVLLTAVLRWPALSLGDVVGVAGGPLAAALLVARCVGAGCFLYSIVRTIRAAGIPW
jgi:hypothetical protein